MSTTTFIAGRLKNYVENWRKITNDETVLDIVQHCHLEFMDGENPVNSNFYRNKFSDMEENVVKQEIENLLAMGVIQEVSHHPNEYISPIFIIPKQTPGEYRLILNLKSLNSYMQYHHFKMDTFETVLKLVKPGMYFASTDIRHGYYSVPIAEEDQVKLRFNHSGKIYQYKVLPNGLCSAPNWFTRLMKPVYASLRMLGHQNSGYIDDSLCLGDSYKECEANVKDTVCLMTDLGFMLHEKKSVLIPSQTITFLGFVMDSVQMVVTLPIKKVEKIVQACSELYKQNRAKIRDVARVLGLLVSSFSAVEYGPLFYRSLERAKIQALQHHFGDFESYMFITVDMKQELFWWIQNLHTQKRRISHENPDLTITSDASAIGWGAVMGSQKIGGRWDETESHNHINVLELLAVSHALKSFCKSQTKLHVQVKSDNSSTVAYINNMGGKTEKLNNIAKDIWLYCKEREIWLTATHIPGERNEADFSSRNFNETIEWKLDESVFLQLVDKFGLPDVDMFATRLNCQLDRFVSWRPDPDAEAINAFSVDWNGKYIYAFPPFRCVSQVLQKARQDRADVLLVAPFWITQNFFVSILEMLTHDPFILKVTQNTLKLPQTSKIHPLTNKLHLLLCRISGNPLKCENYRRTLLISSWPHGGRLHRSNIPRTLTDGFTSVVKGKFVHFKAL